MNTKFLTLCVGMAVLGASVGTAATADGTTAEDSLVTAGNQVPYVGVKAGTEKAKNYNGDGAQADGAIAIGEDAEAQTEYSIAIGKNVNAKGGKLEGYSTYYYPAIGIGMNVKVDGRDAIAIGRGVRAEGKDALALGRDSTADGEITLAIGYNASAKLAKNRMPGRTISKRRQSVRMPKRWRRAPMLSAVTPVYMNSLRQRLVILPVSTG